MSHDRLDDAPESDVLDDGPGSESLDGEPVVLDGELVDALPVVAVTRAIERITGHPVAQVAAAAATGFVAGAATLALARLGARARTRALPSGLGGPLAPPPGFTGVGPTRTYIVRVRTIQRHDTP